MRRPATARGRRAGMGRRGMMQWLWLSLFFLILVIALALLFMERRSLEPMRSELEQDFAHQRADATLIDVMRIPVTLDINGDGIEEQGTLAQLIARNDGSADARISETVAKALVGEWYYALDIEYPDGRKVRMQGSHQHIDALEEGNALALLPTNGGVVRVAFEFRVYPKTEERREHEELLRRSRSRSGGGLGA